MFHDHHEPGAAWQVQEQHGYGQGGTGQDNEEVYQELFDQKDGSKNGKDIEKSINRNNDQKKKTAARIVGEKAEPIISEKGAGSKAQRSLGITGVSVANRNNARDPTFVLSKLLFHMSHLL